MPYRFQRMYAILAFGFFVPWLAPAPLAQSDEPVKLMYPGFHATLRTDTPSLNAEDGSQVSPPNPDNSKRQEKPAQPDTSVTADHPQASSRPVKPVSGQTGLPKRERSPSVDRPAYPVSPREGPDQPLSGDMPARKDEAAPTPARREKFEDQAIAPIAGPTAASDSEAAVRTGSEMDGPRKKEMWRSRRNRERHSDGDLSAVTAAPPANETPLTEEQIQQKIKENNVKQEARWRDEQERLRRHRHWSEVERREWAQEHPNADWTNEELDRWRENHQYFVPQPSWHDQLTFRQQHQRRFCLFDRRRRIYYYPSDIATQTVVLPSEFTPLSVNGRTYYYADGVFYSRDRESFSDVPAPLGALVSALPAGYAAITVGGVEYATSGGVYYKKVAGGYEVTDPPPGFEGVTIENAQGVNGEDAVIVGIPNPKLQGDFIDIKLVRSGSGFTGPQGERYDAFPSIEQLKDMYLP